MASVNSDRCAQYWSVFPRVATYWICSIGLVFMNKYLLSGAGERIDAPIFVTWFQCVVTVVLCFSLSWTPGNLFTRLCIPPTSIKLGICKKVLPLSFIYALMILFSNLCLKNVQVSFYFVAMSLTPIFTLILSILLTNKKANIELVFGCFLIIFGFGMVVDQENIQGSYLYEGVFFGIAASFCMALNIIFSKRFLSFVDNCSTKLMFYNNLMAVFILAPLIFSTGESSFILGHFSKITCWFWIVSTFSGFIGFILLCGLALKSSEMKASSGFSDILCDTTRSAVQTLLGVVYYNETKTFLWWASNCIVLCGLALYTSARMNTTKNKSLQKLGQKCDEQKLLIYINESEN